MNGFDEDTWQELLHDPRVNGEGAYLGPDWEDPLPWQHEAVSTESAGDLYYEQLVTAAPLVVMSNIPLDELGIPTL